ncbi:MAG: DUF2184 domain-containing protein [Elusimicrobiota bacterium]|jgi:hypothetical protein|nr:DUF2184 domain-containing protein [Elusimicrobiota bacterium]
MKYRETLENAGITISGLKGVFSPKDKGVVLDADTGIPTAITHANVGVPVELLTYFDPKAIEVLTAPRNATLLFSDTVKGDWATERRKYRLSEVGGNVASYGDFSENGQADINNEFIGQDYFRFQTMVKYGDLETARNGAAKISLVSDKQRSASTLINIMSNRIYMYGISGLDCYGILNHPLLPANLTPTAGANGTGWDVKTANEIYDDILKVVSDLIDKSSSLIDANSKFKMGVSSALIAYLNKTNQFGISVLDLIKKNYAGMEIAPIPEFSTATGDLVYIIAPEVIGQLTGECVASQKLRTFPTIPEASSYKQKWAAAIGGFSLYIPFAISRMLVS